MVAVEAAIFLLLICPSLFSADQVHTTSLVSFFYNFSDPASISLDDLHFEGDAYVGDGSVVLVKDRLTNTGGNTLRTGRVYYRHPVRLWSNLSAREETGFSASFSFVINGSKSQQNGTGGPGLAFFLAPYTSRGTPLNSGGVAHLGLFNITTSTGGEWFVLAVEMYTHGHGGDAGWEVDPAVSTHNMVVDNLGDGVRMMLQVDYSNHEKVLVVTLQDLTNGGSAMTLRLTVDLRSFLPQEVAIGFSAARGVSEGGISRVLWWSFEANPSHVRVALEESGSSTAPPPVSGNPPSRAQKSKTPIIVGLVVAAALLSLTTAVVSLLYCFTRRTLRRKQQDEPIRYAQEKKKKEEEEKKKKQEEEKKKKEDIEKMIKKEEEKSRRSKYYLTDFSYEELLEATENFAEERMLSDCIYRGVSKGILVAVKKMKVNKIVSAMGEYFFKLERKNPTWHPNLLELFGLCSNGNYLYLVYEYAHNGSLHDRLYNSETTIPWPIRYKIVHGIGFGLCHLHHVNFIHGNIKSSKVLLDSSLGAKLGDYFGGWPRYLVHDGDEASSSSPRRLPASSRGYIDPEVFITSSVSRESDVYSFGIVLLETACGRPPITVQQDATTRLVDFVWELHGKDAILDAADARLNGEFDREEMQRVLLVGLWCAHADRRHRPSIGQAMSYFLNIDVPSRLRLLMPTNTNTEDNIAAVSSFECSID